LDLAKSFANSSEHWNDTDRELAEKLVDHLTPAGECPECGHRPGDIEYMVICVQDRDNPSPFQDQEISNSKLPVEATDLCSTCGAIRGLPTFREDPETGVIARERTVDPVRMIETQRK
jgi:hypothetical protein